MRFRVVTSIQHDSEIARRALDTWDRLLDRSVPVTVYVDDPSRRTRIPSRMRWEPVDSLPGWIEFLRVASSVLGPMPPGDRPVDQKVDPRRGAARFWVLRSALAESRGTRERVIWLDADVVMHRPVERAFLVAVCPAVSPVSYVWGREVSDIGFLSLDASSEVASVLVRRCVAFYADGHWRDAANRRANELFDSVRRAMETVSMRFFDVGRGIGERCNHPFVNSILGSRMDHLRGTRKKAGASPLSDLIVERREPWWTNRREEPRKAPPTPPPGRRPSDPAAGAPPSPDAGPPTRSA